MIALLLCAVLVANHSQLRIRGALQVESDIVQAGLGFVINTSWPLLVAIEVDRAELRWSSALAAAAVHSP